MIEEFSQIVGLLSAFTASRDGIKLQNVVEFNSWLLKHNHKEIVELVNNNASTSVFVKAFLNRELPQIQLKLDTLTAMVELLVKKQDEPAENIKPANIHYAKNVLILMLQRDIAGKYSINDLDVVCKEIEEFLQGESINYNRYVLQQIVRECLECKETAYSIVNKHWHAFLE